MVKKANDAGHAGQAGSVGRPRIGDNKRIIFAARIDPLTKENFVDDAKRNGVSVGVLLDTIATERRAKRKKAK